MIEFFILLGLIVVNGVFAMSELAIVSARPARLQAKGDRGDRGVRGERGRGERLRDLFFKNHLVG